MRILVTGGRGLLGGAVVRAGDFVLDGSRMSGINGGPLFTFSPAISLSVACKDQREVDAVWKRLLVGGKASRCGWLDDKFGVSWQIVPSVMNEMMTNGSKEQMARVTQAFLKMKKFDIAQLQKAYDAN